MINYNKYIKRQETRQKIVSYLKSKHIATQSVSFSLPNSLFRYSGLNEYLIDNLEKGTLTLSNPILFNDIYDASLHRNSFENRCAEEQERIDLLKVFGVSEEAISFEKLRAEAEHEDRFLSQYMKEAFRVGCLSEDNCSILMWSHYAHNNQGICIEYDLSETGIQPFMFPVIYVPNPIDCSDLCDTSVESFDIDLATLLSTIIKSDVWKYEKEWRMILYYPAHINSEERKRVHALVPKPKAIYLGRNFLQFWIDNKRNEDYSLLTRLCKYIADNNIPTYVMKNKLLSYELYPETIDIECVQRLNEGELYEKYLV